MKKFSEILLKILKTIGAVLLGIVGSILFSPFTVSWPSVDATPLMDILYPLIVNGDVPSILL